MILYIDNDIIYTSLYEILNENNMIDCTSHKIKLIKNEYLFDINKHFILYNYDELY